MHPNTFYPPSLFSPPSPSWLIPDLKGVDQKERERETGQSWLITMKFNKEAGGRMNYLFLLPPAWNRNQYFTWNIYFFSTRWHPRTASWVTSNSNCVCVDHISVWRVSVSVLLWVICAWKDRFSSYFMAHFHFFFYLFIFVLKMSWTQNMEGWLAFLHDRWSNKCSIFNVLQAAYLYE